MRITQSTLIREAIAVCGISANGALEVTALLPDQTVRRLIWIHEFHARWNRAYVFRTPEMLPKGTRVLVSGGAASLLTTR